MLFRSSSKIIANKILKLDDILTDNVTDVNIIFMKDNLSSSNLISFKKLIEKNPGTSRLNLSLCDNKYNIKIAACDRFFVKPTEELSEEIETLIAETQITYTLKTFATKERNYKK